MTQGKRFGLSAVQKSEVAPLEAGQSLHENRARVRQGAFLHSLSGFASRSIQRGERKVGQLSRAGIKAIQATNTPSWEPSVLLVLPVLLVFPQSLKIVPPTRGQLDEVAQIEFQSVFQFANCAIFTTLN
jgi:hypothetical protein